jgi:lactoylglutathione lyase
MTSTKKGDYQFPPKEGFILTHFLTIADVKRSAEFYLRILGGKIVQEGEPELFTNG